MKRILRYTLWVTIIVWVCSCQEYKMVEYGEGGQINFMGKNGKLWTDDTSFFHYNKNFGINVDGDSLRADTVIIGVKVSGVTTDYPRRVVFKPVSSGEHGVDVAFLDDYYVSADSSVATFSVEIRRPATRGTVYSTNLEFDYDQSDFEAGISERQVFRLTVRDSVSLKLWGTSEEEWRDYYSNYLGEYSETKIRYLITRYHEVSLNEWENSSNFTELRKGNSFYTDYESYRQDPKNKPLIDENTGREIEFPNLDV